MTAEAATYRTLLPGERLGETCGHHCGIRSTAENTGRTYIAHCTCTECRCPVAVDEMGTINIPMVRTAQAGTPMCWGWYARSGGVRPWE